MPDWLSFVGVGFDVANGVESLIHKSLLQQVNSSTDEPRYGMLETIHEYGRERLAASPETEAIHASHARYFAQLTERAEPDVQLGNARCWQSVLNDEQDNILIALEWSLAGDNVEVGVRLATAIAAFWFSENQSSLNNHWMTRALQYKECVPPELSARLLLAAGGAAWSVHDMERARQIELQALDIFRKLSNFLMMARTLVFLAGTTMGFPDLYAQAKVWLDEALVLARQSGDANIEAFVFNVLGEVARLIGHYVVAKEAYENCLPLTRRAGNRLRETMMLGNFSHVYAHEGNYQRALIFARQMLQLGIEINALAMIAEALNILARALGPLGQPEKAARLYGASEILREQLGARIQAGDLADYENGLAKVRMMLEPTQFENYWAEGRMMEMERAIEYALAGD